MKYNLNFKINYDINYVLLGIRSKIEAYQFAYFLNKSSYFLFHRMKKDISYIINKKKVYFTAFKDLNTEFKRTSFLIKNKTFFSSETTSSQNLFDKNPIINTAFLIPELKEFDYFIKLIGIWKKEEMLELKKFLQTMKDVDPETNIDLSRLKSINNLVF